MTGIPAGLVAILVTLPSPASPAVGADLRTQLRGSFTSAEFPTVSDGRQLSTAGVSFAPRRLTPRGRVLTLSTRTLREVGPVDVKGAKVRRSRRDLTHAGLALIAAGTGMIVLNAIGLSSGTTVPPGGPRDGYLGVPGVVIGCGLVITGGVLLYRAHRVP